MTSKNEFWMGLGGFVFCVQPLYHNTRYYCQDYHLKENSASIPDAVITITQEDLEVEKRLSPCEWTSEKGIPSDKVGAFYELTAIYRKIGDFLSYREASVFHGVLLELNGEGYLFTAKSGTGKSTHAMNWIKAFPEARIINGDKPILRLEGDHLMGYGTPWCGKEHLQVNTKVPVKAVILIERGECNSIEPRSAFEMLSTWLAQTHRSKDPQALERMMDTALEMLGSVRLFCLHCNMDPESALVAKQGIDQAPDR